MGDAGSRNVGVGTSNVTYGVFFYAFVFLCSFMVSLTVVLAIEGCIPSSARTII